jgi:hypothetical protein
VLCENRQRTVDGVQGKHGDLRCQTPVERFRDGWSQESINSR